MASGENIQFDFIILLGVFNIVKVNFSYQKIEEKTFMLKLLEPILKGAKIRSQSKQDRNIIYIEKRNISNKS